MPSEWALSSSTSDTSTSSAWIARPLIWLRKRRWFAVIVLAPTLVSAVYMSLFAANQYESEARFLVRSQSPPAASVLGQVLGAAAAPSSEEANGVVSFLRSHDAVRALKGDLDLVSIWRRNGLDFLSGVKAKPTEEELTRFYEKRVGAVLNSGTGIITLKVRSFRPEDSKAIADRLLGYSEGLVNKFSSRAEADTLRIAREEVARSERRVADLSGRVTRLRDETNTLDPTSSARVVTEVVGGLEAQLAKARAELAAMQTYLRPGSPRLVEQETRVASIQSQLASQRSRLTGERSLAPTVAGFERIGVEREFANRGYASALTSLETARLNAQRQHVYLIRVVEPNLPEKSTLPRRLYTVLSVFGGLLLAYGIGWVVSVGVREHAA